MKSAVNTWQNLPSIRGEYKFNEPLSKYTWFNVGGPAEILFLPEDEVDLCNFLQQRPQNLGIFVLGGGANILVRDGGIDGVVIKLKNDSVEPTDIFICKNCHVREDDNWRYCKNCGRRMRNGKIAIWSYSDDIEI